MAMLNKYEFASGNGYGFWDYINWFYTWFLFLVEWSTFLGSNRGKRVAWPTGNYWQSAFDAVGLPMFSPVTGVSEFQTMKQSQQLLGSGEVVYCMESDGLPCGTCSKCFRRDVIRAYLDDKHLPNWANYQTESIVKFLQKRPLYFGHIFSTAFSLKPSIFPNWILNEVKDLREIESEWTMKVYKQAFELCAKDWREYISIGC